MVGVSTQQWESVERSSPTLFLVAGVLLAGYATLNGFVAGTETGLDAAVAVVGPAGFALGFVGLLGLYPGLAERSPMVARAGAVCAALGAIGFAAITLHGLTQLGGVELPGWITVFVIFGAIGMIPGYLSFGVASLRADVLSGTVGILLFAPAVVFTVMLSQAVLFAQFGLFSETILAWSAVAISGGQALAHLAIGYTLRTGRTSAEHEGRTSDAVAS